MSSAVKKPKIILINTGIKVGTLPKADLYLDCRGIPNPYRDKILGPMSGDAEIVQDWVIQQAPDSIKAFQQMITDGIDKLPIRRAGSDDPYSRPFVICAFCAHGIHRSKAIKHILSRLLVRDGFTVEIDGLIKSSPIAIREGVM